MTAGPVADTFDFWPFDIPPGTEFLLVYAVIALVGIVLAKAVQVGLLSLVAPGDAAGPPPPDPYRAGPRAAPRLAVGTYPSIEDNLHIAYLRGGERALEEAVLAQAGAEGWILPAPPPALVHLYALPNDASSASRELAANLHAPTATAHSVRLAARQVATRASGAVHRDLVDLGLLHPTGRRVMATLAFGGVAALVLAIGVIRAVRGAELGRSIGFLVVEILVVAGAAAIVARPKRRSDAGEKYLKWITDSTHSLRQDVLAGRTRRPADVALAGATAGLLAVPMMAVLWPQTASAFGDGSSFGSSSCSSSSCSSSSCGGGGGCGSSCGGGGGCGG